MPVRLKKRFTYRVRVVGSDCIRAYVRSQGKGSYKHQNIYNVYNNDLRQCIFGKFVAKIPIVVVSYTVVAFNISYI